MSKIFEKDNDGLVLGTDDDDLVLVVFGDAVIEGLGGDDKIINVKGNNNIYGDVALKAFDIVTAAPTEDMLDTSVIDDAEETFTYGNDLIHAGAGDDIVSGDIGELRFSLETGEVIFAGGDSSAVISNKTFELGNDIISGGSGRDQLYGDIILLNLNIVAGDVALDGLTETGASNGNVTDMVFIFGNDDLKGGSDDDELYGDVGEISLNGIGGDTNSASVSGDSVARNGFHEFLAGADNLKGNSGNDLLYGDIGHLNMDFTSGDFLYQEDSAAGHRFSTFNFGDVDVISDVLEGGTGDDHLYGDIGLWTINAESGKVGDDLRITNFFIRSGVVHRNTTYQFSADHLKGGDGNDYLYGDIGQLLLNIVGGTAPYDPDAPFSFALSAAWLDLDNTYLFGHDLLEGGKGNDWIYGDIGQLEVTLSGEDNPAEEQQISNKTFTLGNDTLKGDDGDDHLFGDIGESTSLELFVNSFDPTGQGHLPSIITFGDDVLYGGSGNDVLVGDMRGYVNANLLIDDNPFDTFFNTAIWGNDELYGEDGHDRLEGSLGNDILDGGNGNDILIGGPDVGPQNAPPEPDEIGDIEDVGDFATNVDEAQVKNNTLATAQEIDRLGFGDLNGGTAENPSYFDILDVPSLSVSGLSSNVQAENEDLGLTQYDGPFDVDVYKIFLNAGENLTIDVDDDLMVAGAEVLERFDTTIFVYDSMGNLLADQDDIAADSGDIDDGTSRLDFIVPEDGVYYIAVSPFYNTGSGLPDITDETADDELMNDPDHITVAYQLSLSISVPVTVGPAAEDDDILTGGMGNDIFVFGLGDDEGALGLFNNDIVTDFTLGDDILEFNNVIDVNMVDGINAADLDAATEVVDNGIDTMIYFGSEADPLGSVMLQGFTGLSEATFFQDLDAVGALNINVDS